MKKSIMLTAAAIMLFLLAGLAQAQNGARAYLPEQITFYQIDLVCKAAPKIGCGPLAKPMLLELEERDDIAEAWLNRTGTIIALVWKEKPAKAAFETLTALVQKRNLTISELADKARAEALTDFLSETGWYRGSAVDQLSQEEAEIIAARLARRVKAQLKLSDERANSLQRAFAAALRQRLTTQSSGSREERTEQIKNELMEAGRRELSHDEMAALEQALSLGYRPLPDEN